MLYGVGRLGAIRKFGGAAVVGPLTDGVPILAEEDRLGKMFFNSDGTVLTIWTFNDLNVYSLSTPYDVRTADFNETETVDVTSSVREDGHLSSDGTKVFFGDRSTSTSNIESYNLSTPYDFTTISSTPDATVDVAGAGFTRKIDYIRAITLSSDGTKLFAAGGKDGDRDEAYIVEYTLSTAFDITTITTDTDSRLIAGSSGSPDVTVGSNRAIFSIDSMQLTNNDTTLLCTFEDLGTPITSRIIQYTMSSPADLTGMSITHNVDLQKRISETGYWFSFVRRVSALMSSQFSPDGTKLYVGGQVHYLGIIQLNCSTPFDISTASFDSDTSAFLENEFGNGSPNSQIHIPASGDELYIADAFGKRISQYSFGTSFDPTTLTHSGVGTAQTSLINTAQMRGITLNADGTKAYYIDYNDKRLYQATLSTAYDITTMPDATLFYDYTTDLGGFGLQPFFNPDGSKLYISRFGGYLYQWDLATNFDVTSAKSNNQILDLTAITTSYAQNFDFNSDGTKLISLDFADGKEYYIWTLSTAYDISTAGSPTTTATTRQTDSGIDFSDLNNNAALISGVKLVNDDTLIFQIAGNYTQPFITQIPVTL